MGIDAHELRRLTQRVEERRDLRAAEGLRAVVILPADHRSAQRPLRGIVVERDARIVEESREAGPPFEHVADGLAQFAPRQADLLGQPSSPW